MIKYLFITAALSVTLNVNGTTVMPSYTEPVDTAKVDVSGWQLNGKPLTLTWVSKDFHYRQFATPPTCMSADTTVTAWRGERLGVEALIVCREETGPMRVSLSDFIDARGRKVAMPGSSAMFMRYVLADDVRDCSYQSKETPVFTLPDMIDLPGTSVAIPAKSVRPIWCTVEVPRSLTPGRYVATLSLESEKGDRPVEKIKLNIDVLDRTLPKPKDYAFYLDLWQQPYAISRYYGVKPWSDRHIELLKPYAEYMARGGQKTVTTVLFYEPWGEQSNDKFDPMVETLRNPDGSWSFDYTIFDKYVEFMADNGIDRHIECFTMIPWEMKFRYFDKASGEYRFLDAPSSSSQYKELWMATLKSLEKHLKAKGWFEKSIIFMDERGADQMRDAVAVLREVTPDFKMGLAGEYHEELVDELYNYTLGNRCFFSASELERRRQKGLVTLMYTCCTTPEPSQFTSNSPADGAYIPVYCTATGFDGYLHWSFQNWNNNPMVDTRFFKFGSGDTFFIYPDGRSSVRYERLVEGIQLSEKIRLLRQEMTAADDIRGLLRLEEALIPLRSGAFSAWCPTSTVVNELTERVAALSRE